MIRILILFVSFSAFAFVNAPKAEAQISVSFQAFYDDMSPYGDWVYHSRYGYVWTPRVSNNFRPYSTNGHWVYTRRGWTWVSNYRWGWAAFHYGRWFRDRYYGWVWVPDTEWAPAWVTWRSSQGYFGWAPIGPGISIEIAFGNNYNLPYDDWRFVREGDFGRNDLDNYYVPSNNYTTIINNSTVINNIQIDNSQHISYNAGPNLGEVERRSHKTFSPVEIRESSKPEENLGKNELSIYKPQVRKEADGGRKPAPTKVATWKDSKTDGQPDRKPQPNVDRNPPVKEPRKEPVQPVREPRKDPVQPVREPRKDPVQPVKEPRKDPVQPVREPRKDPVQPVKEPRKDPVQPVKEPRKDPVQPVREPRKDPVQPVKEPRKDPVQPAPPVREQKKDVPPPVKKDNPPPVKKDNPPRKK